MSYNQKPPGPSGSSGTGIGSSAPNGPNNQTPQQVAKTLAGIQQQMQNLVHGQNALPQSTPADLNAFFQQQRFQNMLKQQQQQLLQQHFQQQMQQQQNKDRGGSGGGEPLALTRTPAAAELLNKTYQQHHQQQPNGSSAPNPTLASVNQQIQQQLQAFPPNIMQQLQAFQYQMQQQQQQHPQQQQHHTQPPLQQAHQQAQSGQHQTPQHQAVQQQLHGQTHQQQQKALTTAAAAHMQQLQQSLQQKYLSAAAAANQTAVAGNKMGATPPPPPLTNQIKPPSLPPSTQITPVPPVTIGVGLANTSSSVNSVLAAISSLPAPSASKQVPPSISLVPAKQPATSPTFSGGHQQNKFVTSTPAGTVSNKSSPMVSAIPAPFPTHYQKPSTAATTIAGANSSSSLSSAKSVVAVTSDTMASKSPQTTLSSKPPIQQQQQQQQPLVATTTTNQAPKLAVLTSTVASTLNSSQVSAQKPIQVQTPVASNQQTQQQRAENGNKTSSIAATGQTVKDPKPSEEVSVARVADNTSEETKSAESAIKETQPIIATNTIKSPTKLLENPAESSKSTGSSDVETAVIEVSSITHAKTEKDATEETKEKIAKKVDHKTEDPIVETIVEEKKENVENLIKETEEIPISAKTNEKEGKKSPSVDTEKINATPLLDDLEKQTPVISDDKVAPISTTETNSSKEDSPISITALKPSLASTSTKDAAPLKVTDKSDKIVESKIEIKEQNSSIEKPIKAVETLKEKIAEKQEKPVKKDEKQSMSTVVEETSSEIKIKKTKQESSDVKEIDSPNDMPTVKVKAIENVSSCETPVRKHGRQARTTKTTSVIPVTQKVESQPKRGSREERRNSKIKSEVYTESSPPSTPIDTLSKSNDRKSQRHRLKTILYQSPLPELAYITKLSASEASNSPKPMSVEDKLIVFYKNEYMAVRNAEGTFYLCQTMQNVYRTSPRISIRWLSEDKKDSSIFIPDFYDHTDIECVLTTVELKRVEKGQLRLPKTEKSRIESILKKAIDVEKGLLPRPDITEENPDGLDLSLYKDESQIEKRTAGQTPSSAGRKSRRSGNAAKSSTPTTERKRKRGFSLVGGNKSPNKKRKTLTKKKKSSKKNSSDEDVTSDEESDAEYKPNQKKANSLSTSKSSPRAQRSPLAKARAASPITPTSSKTKTPVPQTLSSTTSTTNNRIDRANKRKSALEISSEVSTPTPAKKLGTSNAAKATILKIKAQESGAEATNRKTNETSSNIMDNSPSTSAGAAGSGGTRPTRNRK